jgi:hypothetical protein
MVSQRFKKFSAFYRNQRFLNVFMKFDTASYREAVETSAQPQAMFL